jgi:hypothetical protein
LTHGIRPHRVVVIGAGSKAATLPVAGRLAVVAVVIGGTLFSLLSAAGPTGMEAFAYLAMGGLLVIRRPRTSIGWILLVLGLCYGALSVPITAKAHEFVDGTVELPVAIFAVVHSGLGTASFFLYGLLAFVFPSGHLPAGRWARPAKASLAVALGCTAAAFVMPVLYVGFPGSEAAPNPAALFPDLPIWRVVTPSSVIFPVMALVIAGAVSLGVRVRRSRGVEREQLRWIAASFGVLMSAVMSGVAIAFLVPGASDTGLPWIPAMLAFPMVPVAIGIAVLRYRLYEIDRIISRTISYACLSALLIAIYAGLILLLQAPLAAVTGGETIGVAVSTLAAAALFQPLRRRVQAAVDRRFNRARYDVERTTSRFAARLRNELDPTQAQSALLASVDVAVAPRSAGIWIRGDRGPVASAPRLGW